MLHKSHKRGEKYSFWAALCIVVVPTGKSGLPFLYSSRLDCTKKARTLAKKSPSTLSYALASEPRAKFVLHRFAGSGGGGGRVAALGWSAPNGA